MGRPPTEAEIELIDNGFQSGSDSPHDLDYILEAPDDRALRWLEEKARNADGLRAAHALVAPTSIEAAARLMKAKTGPLSIKRSRKRSDAWPIIVFGLQNAMAGLGCVALATRHAVSTSTASRYVCAHGNQMLGNEQYADACRLVAAKALVECHTRDRIS